MTKCDALQPGWFEERLHRYTAGMVSRVGALGLIGASVLVATFLRRRALAEDAALQAPNAIPVESADFAAPQSPPGPWQ
jgi:hypothetical protein